MPPTARLVVLTLLVCLSVLLAPLGASAQSLPIPGLPGGLGGVGTDGQDTTDPGQSLPPGPAGATGEASSPTQALIDILKDDAAREALIEELEAAAGNASTAPADATPPATDDGADQTPSIVDQPSETFGARTVEYTRTLGTLIVQDLRTLWLRAQRIPNTLQLSLRAFEGDVLENAVREIATIALMLYAALLLLRIITTPVRRRIGRAANEASWLRRVTMRTLASALDLALIPVAIFVGIFAMVAFGLAVERDQEVVMTDAQALFINAFATVEGARAAARFLLSPRTPEMRLVNLPEAAVDSLWRTIQLPIFFLGYGQLLIVPIVSEGVSIFVGRALASVIAAIVEIALIFYVLAHRHSVADWLYPEDREGPYSETLRSLAVRWHWPIMAYLLLVLTVVLTRPGNVLLPLLGTTAQVVLAIILGAIIFGALGETSSRRVRIPQGVASRLPLLEERLNSLVPFFLKILRAVVVVLVIFVVLDILNIQSLGGLLSSDFAARISSGLLSVLLIVLLLAIVWLGMTSWVDYRLNPFIGAVPTPREITLLTLMKNAVTVALIILGVITSLAQLGMNVGPLIASAGVIGLAISFGAQRMVEDIFSGIFIQAEGAMNVGDVVDVGGTIGTVERLTVRSVTLRDLSGVVHVIPFSSAAKISNYMRDFAYHVADVGVAYRENLEEVKQAMHDGFDILRQNPDVAPNIVGDLEWFGLNAFGASEVQVRARIKTIPGQQWGVGRAYNAIIKQLFDERGIEIPFPHQTVYFGEDKRGTAPPIHVQLSSDTTDEHADPVQEPPLTREETGETTDAIQPSPGADIPSNDDGR